MKKEQIKQELINRYKYIYENAVYILAPYMYQQTKEEREELNKKYRKENKKHPFITNDLLINLNELPSELLLDLESFLLSDVPFNQSKLFVELEEKKKNTDFLNKVKNGLNLLEQHNLKKSYYQIKLDFWKLLVNVRDFINEQSNDLKNKDKKLTALDEYFRINRYNNDGIIWTSGFSINFKDINNNYSSFYGISPKNKPKPSRDKKDIGLKKGDFINFIADKSNHYDYNFSILTEQEKRDIYLTYHDELPYNLEKVCEIEEEYDSTDETRLKRPDHTNPCGETFYVNENEIFVNPTDSLYRYYQLCPLCGFIVNIPKEILSDGIKKRIEERCMKDPNLFRKMYLYSELFSLDKSSSKEQKKILKIK